MAIQQNLTHLQTLKMVKLKRNAVLPLCANIQRRCFQILTFFATAVMIQSDAEEESKMTILVTAW